MRKGEARARSDRVPALRRKAAQGRARKVCQGQGGRHPLRRQRPGTVPRVCARQEQAARSGTTGRSHVHALCTHPPVEGGTVCEPCRVARRDRSGNNMPRGESPVCAAGAARPRPVMPRVATGAPGTRPNAQEKRRRIQEAASATPGGAHGGFVQTAAHHPRARPGVPPCARRSWARSGEHRGLPLLPPRVTVIEIATGKKSWDMGPVGRCSGLPGLRQAFPGPGGADPGYVEHRPVSGAGARKLVAARYARFREFAPLRLARPPPAGTVRAAIFGKWSRCFRCFSMTP